MIEEREKTKHSGRFTIEPGREIYGELTLDGPKSSLYVWDKDFFNPRGKNNGFVKGILHNLTKVSLIDCITSKDPGSFSNTEESHHFARLFPHYAILGDQHISPAEDTIAEVHFVIDDATTLFHDLEAFGRVSNARSIIEKVVQHDVEQLEHDREIKIGAHPEIVYFTGKSEIFSADTELGKISAYHNPSTTFLSSPEGVKITNKIFAKLEFADPITLEDVIDRTYRVLHFFGLLVGRPQNLVELWILKKVDQKRTADLRVYWSHCPKYERIKGRWDPHHFDVLINPIRDPEIFSYILTKWLDREWPVQAKNWYSARVRFFKNFEKQEYYDIDRLIGAANMFDILPPEAVSGKFEISEDLKSARDKCRQIFKRLPGSPDRNSVLSALGRIGKSTLKKKVRHRAQFLIDKVGDKIPDFFTITDEAVDCRNYYVHGSPPSSRIDYNQYPGPLHFLTNTLEFVFAASDLVEAGWDIKKWCKSQSRTSHPFGHYLYTYLSEKESVFSSSKIAQSSDEKTSS
ncbi:MAG: hypothetical protein F4Y79_18570 [Gemmatimonadetes bacterium]|nr:hypothetical protein [Gemmatimonadota bacterium]